MAKRVDRRRKRAQPNTNDDGLAVLHRDLARQLRQWRELIAEFDRVHRAGIQALRRGQFARLDTAIHHEQRIIEKQNGIIQEAKARLDRYKVIPRTPQGVR